MVAAPLIVCTHAQTPEAILCPKEVGAYDLGCCEEAGATVAAGLALGIFLGEATPSSSASTWEINSLVNKTVGLSGVAALAPCLLPCASGNSR